MRVIIPHTITEAMLDSTVLDNAGNLFDNVTIYPAGEIVSIDAGADLAIYESSISGNVGNDPTLAPSAWTFRGRTFKEFNFFETVSKGVVRKNSADHTTWKSLQFGNVSHYLTESEWWAPAGATNRFAMFDLSRSSASVAPSSITVVVTPGKRCDAIALVGMLGATYSLTVTSIIGGGTVLSESGTIPDRDLTGWLTWMTMPFFAVGTKAFDGINAFSDCVVTLTINAAAGDASISGLVIGRSFYLGDTQYSAVSGVSNYSRVSTDPDTGESYLLPKKATQRLRNTLFLSKDLVPVVRNLRGSLDAVPAVFIGIDDQMSGYYETLSALGVATQFDISTDYPNHATINLEITEI